MWDEQICQIQKNIKEKASYDITANHKRFSLL